MSEIIIYKTNDNQVQIEVELDEDTVWLTQSQIVELFESSKGNISEHVKHIFKSNELTPDSTVRKIRTVRKEGKRSVARELEYYNLDMIISVGYRVNSMRGTQFRIWANRILKEHLVKGYTINEKRLKEQAESLKELEHAVSFIVQSAQNENLQLTEAKGLLEIIHSYTRSFVLLNRYDSNSLLTEPIHTNITYVINYNEAASAIDQLKIELLAKKEASPLFGNQKDQSFEGTLRGVVQTFDGQYLYPSIEEQAAHLLYFVIKNHPFSDGNKRIGAFLFVWFLDKNRHRFRNTGELKINDNTLVALALLVAQSNPADKELMIKLIINMINQP